MKRIYVGNLPFSATEDGLRRIFAERGVVHSVSLINDRETGRFHGHGFVEIEDDALENVLKLDGKSMDGRPMRVAEAQEAAAGG